MFGFLLRENDLDLELFFYVGEMLTKLTAYLRRVIGFFWLSSFLCALILRRSRTK